MELSPSFPIGNRSITQFSLAIYPHGSILSINYFVKIYILYRLRDHNYGKEMSEYRATYYAY